MYIKRRSFLKMGAMASASLFVPRILHALNLEQHKNIIPRGDKILIVLQMSGGNDGLNTVVPFRNDLYYKARPTLALKKNNILPLTDEAALHASLQGFRSLFDQGHLGILNNVGYANPDRSHFRSLDIWHSGSKSDERWQTGWLGRYLDHECNNCDLPTQALEIDDVLSLAMKGERQKGIALKNPGRLFANSNQKYVRKLVSAPAAHLHAVEHERPVDYLYKTMASTLNSAEYIFEQSKLRSTTATYPKTELGKNLKTVASLILSDINTSVYYLNVGSFDTHVNQHDRHTQLLKQIDEAVATFAADMKDNNRWEDILLFTFSEFGRRVQQNASNGTDHGTANNMFFAGGSLKEKGLLNVLPDLADLENGDLKYQVDFKSVYATVLKNWLGADDTAILKSRNELMSFV